MKINVIFLEPAKEFIESLPEKAKKKVVYNINRVSNGEINKDLFKKLGDTDIWEFRTVFNGSKYRLLAFWDVDRSSIIVAANGFMKKTQKTPQKEIERAIMLRTEYYNDKE